MPSIVIPAHNEALVIGRLLTRLTDDDRTPHLEVIVVCNGCTDDTDDVARSFQSVRVVATGEAGKPNALRLGDSIAGTFPRIHVDADVEIDRAAIHALCRALEAPGVLAAAPERRIALGGSSTAVRLYYEFWQSLPRVKEGLFGRGVIAVSEAGFARLASLPELMADDLAASAAFAPDERRIVPDALVVVHPPRTWGALLRRRVRAATGTHQYFAEPGLAPRVDSRTTTADLVTVVRSRPSHLMRLPVFLAATILARRGAAKAARSSDYTTWQRDDSRDQP